MHLKTELLRNQQKVLHPQATLKGNKVKPQAARALFSLQLMDEKKQTLC